MKATYDWVNREFVVRIPLNDLQLTEMGLEATAVILFDEEKRQAQLWHQPDPDNVALEIVDESIPLDVAAKAELNAKIEADEESAK